MTQLDAARTLGILNYISPHEKFDSEEEKIGEALYRASAVCVLAYEQEKQSYQEFSIAMQRLKTFCETYNYNFGEYCYNFEEYCQDLQNYGIISDNQWKETEELPKTGRITL